MGSTDTVTIDDGREALIAFAELADTTWKLRNARLKTRGLSPMVVKLEDAVLKLEESIVRLEADLQNGQRGSRDQ